MRVRLARRESRRARLALGLMLLGAIGMSFSFGE
jgi:hypothetical protein